MGCRNPYTQAEAQAAFPKGIAIGKLNVVKRAEARALC